MESINGRSRAAACMQVHAVRFFHINETTNVIADVMEAVAGNVTSVVKPNGTGSSGGNDELNSSQHATNDGQHHERYDLQHNHLQQLHLTSAANSSSEGLNRSSSSRKNTFIV